MFPSSYSPNNLPTGKVANAKTMFERQQVGAMKTPFWENAITSVQPAHLELIEKEKPIIAELMIKLRNREQAKGSDASYDSSAPGNSVMSLDSFESAESFTPVQPNIDPVKSPKRTRTKTLMERVLTSPDQRQKFHEFLKSKDAIENLEFWEACEECGKNARGGASLAKKIISQLMIEIKETHGHPEKEHMDLALNSAVVAVRYELMMHREEIYEAALAIVNRYVRDESPQRVNLSTEKRNALIQALGQGPDHAADNHLLSALSHAQHELRDLMERKYYGEFSSQL